MKHKQILRPGDLAQFSIEISPYRSPVLPSQMSIKNFPLLCLQIHERNGWLTTADGLATVSQPTSEGSDVIINAIDLELPLDVYRTLEDHPGGLHRRISVEQRINPRKGTTIASFSAPAPLPGGRHLVILFNDDNLQIFPTRQCLHVPMCECTNVCHR